MAWGLAIVVYKGEMKKMIKMNQHYKELKSSYHFTFQKKVSRIDIHCFLRLKKREFK